MQIENKLEAAKIRLSYIIIVFVLSILILWSALKELPYNIYNTAIFASLVFIVYLVMVLLKLFYFYMNDSGQKIVVRFFNIHPFLQKYKAIEIPKKALAGYEIKTSFFDLKAELILAVKTKKGEIEYPPVSISALSRKDRKRLINALDSQIKLNRTGR